MSNNNDNTPITVSQFTKVMGDLKGYIDKRTPDGEQHCLPACKDPEVVKVKATAVCRGPTAGPHKFCDEIYFEIKVENCGNTDAHITSIETDFPSPINIASFVLEPGCYTRLTTQPHKLTKADVQASPLATTICVNGQSASGVQFSAATVGICQIEALPKAKVSLCFQPVAIPAGAVAGDTVMLPVKVQNESAAPLSGVNVPQAGEATVMLDGWACSDAFMIAHQLTAEDIAACYVKAKAIVNAVDKACDISLCSTATTVIPIPKDVTAPAIAIVKSCDPPGPYAPGDTVTYTFDVTNTGSEDLTNVQVTDNLGSVVGGPIDLAVGANDATSFTMDYVIPADAAAGPLVNTASVTADGDVSGTPVTASDDHTVDVVLPTGPSITLDKSCDPPGPFNVGDTVNYTFTVTNNGLEDLTGVTIADNLGVVMGGPIDLAVGASDSTTFTMQYVITADDPSPLVNIAMVSATGVDSGEGVMASSDHTVEIMTTTTQPSIALEKSCDPPGPFAVGDTVTYTFTVTNDGSEDLTNVVVLDDLGTVMGGPIDLAVGASDSTTFTMTYTILDGDPSPLVNTASVTADGSVSGTPVSASDEHSVDLISNEPSIVLEKSCDPAGPFQVGDEVCYQFTVTNNGSEDLTGVMVSDDLGTVVGGPIDLAVGASDSTTFTMKYTITAEDATPLVNTASVAATGVDSGTPVSASDDHTVEILPAETACIALVKDCTPPGPYAPGDEVTFVFSVENCGTSDLTNVVITDDTVTMAGGPIDLAVGATDTTSFTGTYTIAADAADGDYTNNASVTADVVGGGDPVSATASHSYTVGSTTDCSDDDCSMTGESPELVVPESGLPSGLVAERLTCGLFGTGLYGSTGNGALQEVQDNGNIASIPVPDHSADCVLVLHITGGQIVSSGLPVLAGTSGASVVPAEWALDDLTSGAGTVGSGTNPNGDIFQGIYVMDGAAGGGTVDIELPNLSIDSPSDLLMWSWSQICPTKCPPLRVAQLSAPIYQGAGASHDPMGADPFDFTGGETAFDSFTVACNGFLFTAGRHAGGYGPLEVPGAVEAPAGTVDYSAYPTITYTIAGGHNFVVGDVVDVCTAFGDQIQNTVNVTAVIDANTFQTDVGSEGGFEGIIKPTGTFDPNDGSTQAGCIDANWSGAGVKSADPSTEIYDMVTATVSECQGGLGLHQLPPDSTNSWWYEHNVPAGFVNNLAEMAIAAVMSFDICDVPDPVYTELVTVTKQVNFCTFPAQFNCGFTGDIAHDIGDGDTIVVTPEFDGVLDSAQAVTLTGTGTTNVGFTSGAGSIDANGSVSCQFRLCIQQSGCSSFTVPAAPVTLQASKALARMGNPGRAIGGINTRGQRAT